MTNSQLSTQGRPYCGIEGTSRDSYEAMRSRRPRSPDYVTSEAVWRASELSKRRAALSGEFLTPHPKEGEWFGQMATKHFLDATQPSIAVGSSKTGSHIGGHFERTLKPVDRKRWLGARVSKAQASQDFCRSVQPLSPTDKNDFLGAINFV